MAEAQAVLRFARISPRKARPVVDLIRGQQVPMALALLRNIPRQASKVVEKILPSAVANAEQKQLGDSDSMVVSKAFVNCGPTLKRFRSLSQGRANSIHKRMSHITVVVSAASTKEKDVKGISEQNGLISYTE